MRFDEARIEVDWVASFVGWRTMKLVVKFTDQEDPLLKAILARNSQQLEEKIANQKEPTLADADLGVM